MNLKPAIDVCPTEEEVALVAAAPRLLQALRDMVEHFATFPEDRTAISYHKTKKQVAQEACAAIAAAEGKATQ